MLVKMLPIRGTNVHVWAKKKYYPDGVYTVDDDLGELFVKRKMAVEHKEKAPPKRGPGRPRKDSLRG